MLPLLICHPLSKSPCSFSQAAPPKLCEPFPRFLFVGMERWKTEMCRRKYTDLLISPPALSLFLCNAPKTGKRIPHTCQLQSRGREKNIPLWAVHMSQGGWLPVLLGENPWLLCCSCGAHKQMNTVLIFVGKSGWSSSSFSKCFCYFCVALPASLKGFTSSTWHRPWNSRDAPLTLAPCAVAVCQNWSPRPCVGESPCFQLCVVANVWVQQCPPIANLQYS